MAKTLLTLLALFDCILITLVALTPLWLMAMMVLVYSYGT